MRNKKVTIIVSIVALAAFVLLLLKPGAKDSSKTLPKPKNKEVVEFQKEGVLWFINNGDTIKTIDLEFAISQYEITKGLMDRRVMKEDQGMLFIFNRMEPRSFWMKNTPLSLDILFITDKLEVESIQKNTEPYSQASIPSKGLAQYVLEVNAGFSDKFGITEGTQIAFEAVK